MSHRARSQWTWVVVTLKSGENVRPVGLKCIYPFCRRTMLKVSRDVDMVIDNNKGIHWSDIPDDVTVVEHKCRGCDHYYKIYTPSTASAQQALQRAVNNELTIV